MLSVWLLSVWLLPVWLLPVWLLSVWLPLRVSFQGRLVPTDVD